MSDARQLLGIKGASETNNIWKLRLQLMKPITWVPLLWGVICGAAASGNFQWNISNLLASDNALPAPAVCLGLEANVGEGVFAGIDSDGTDHRLYVKMGYGTFGMGTNSAGDAQFTIGGNYSVLDRFSVNLDYVLNQLTDDGGGDPFPDELRVSLKVDF